MWFNQGPGEAISTENYREMNDSEYEAEIL